MFFFDSPTFLNYSFICSPSEVTTELTVQFASPLNAMISKTKILPWDSSSLGNTFCHDHLLQCLLVSWKHQGYNHTINLPLCSISNTKSTYVLVPFPLTILWVFSLQEHCTWERKQEKEISKDQHAEHIRVRMTLRWSLIPAFWYSSPYIILSHRKLAKHSISASN